MNEYSFKEIIDNAKKEPKPVDILLDQICALTGRKKKTVKMWYYGTQYPPAKEMMLLESHFKTTSEILFPNRIYHEKNPSKTTCS